MNLNNSKLFNTDKKREIECQDEFKSTPNISLTDEKKKIDQKIYEKIFKEEVEKELQKRKNIYNEFKLLLSKKKKDSLLGRGSPNHLNELIDNENSSFKKDNLISYIISKTWINQFKHYCLRQDLSYLNINEDYPGQINNHHLILKDDNCLKLRTDNRIIINSKYSDNYYYINEDVWKFVVDIYGGGPEIKLINNKDNNNNIDDNNNEIEVIENSIHINLLFIPKKQILSNNSNKEPSKNLNDPLNPFQTQEIKKILVNNEQKNKIKIHYIYFDITKNIQ